MSFEQDIRRLEQLYDRTRPGWRQRLEKRAAHQEGIRRLLRIRPLAKMMRDIQRLPTQAYYNFTSHTCNDADVARIFEPLPLRPRSFKICGNRSRHSNAWILEIEMTTPRGAEYYIDVPVLRAENCYNTTPFTAWEVALAVYQRATQMLRREARNQRLREGAPEPATPPRLE